MSDIKMPAVTIPRQHQSSPRQHEADKAIQQAAEEIDSHKWIDDDQREQREAVAGMGLTMGLGNDAAAVGAKPALEDFRRTYEQNQVLDQIGRHPRVVEALDKMKHEVEETKGHELIEKNCALRELVTASEKGNHWDGQGRWVGRDNEEMRYGRILTPAQFMDQLQRITGPGRLILSEHIVFSGPNQKSGISGIYMKNPKWDGEAQLYREGKRAEIRRMEDEARKLQFDADVARKQGNDELAESKIQECAILMLDAIKMADGVSQAQATAEPEYLRVATIQWPLSTEWMIVSFTEWGAVWKPRYYGWRTALLTMIRCGAITEAEAHRAFPIEPGPAADWYQEQIYRFNHGPQILN